MTPITGPSCERGASLMPGRAVKTPASNREPPETCDLWQCNRCCDEDTNMGMTKDIIEYLGVTAKTMAIWLLAVCVVGAVMGSFYLNWQRETIKELREERTQMQSKYAQELHFATNDLFRRLTDSTNELATTRQTMIELKKSLDRFRLSMRDMLKAGDALGRGPPFEQGDIRTLTNAIKAVKQEVGHSYIFLPPDDELRDPGEGVPERWRVIFFTQFPRGIRSQLQSE